jgi:hypothetical protein
MLVRDICSFSYCGTFEEACAYPIVEGLIGMSLSNCGGIEICPIFQLGNSQIFSFPIGAQ